MSAELGIIVGILEACIGIGSASKRETQNDTKYLYLRVDFFS